MTNQQENTMELTPSTLTTLSMYVSTHRDRSYIALRSGVRRRKVQPVQVIGGVNWYETADLDAVFVRKEPKPRYIPVQMEDSRPDGSVTLYEFLALYPSAIKYPTLTARLRTAKVAPDGFIYRDSRKKTTYPLATLKALTFGE